MKLSPLQSKILKFTANHESELRRLITEIEVFAPDILWMKWFEIFDDIVDVPRAWWIREEVWIPVHLAESVLQHSLNVKQAADSLILGTPEMVENHKRFPIMWLVHDMPEKKRILPDITPHDGFTQQQKDTLEKYAVLLIEQTLGSCEQVDSLKEYIKQETKDAQLMHLLDKLDAGIKALDYERLWYSEEVAAFHPYTQEKISWNSYISDIYNIMLEREYMSISPHLQYFILLWMWGKYDDWRRKMNGIAQRNENKKTSP